LNNAARDADLRELAECYQAARDGAIGTEPGILFEILELVGDSELQEEQQGRDERHDEGGGRRATDVAAREG
jgi:hypothetical protein